MFSADNLNSLLREVLAQFGGQDGRQASGAAGGAGSTGGTAGTSSITPSGLAVIPGKLTPAQALVITGLLGGVFEVTSILVDKNQAVEILLTGSLKMKTPLAKMLDNLGGISFDEVVRAMLERFGL